MHLPRQVLRAEVLPTEAGERAVPPREAGSDRRMVGDAAAEDVTDEGLDRVRLGEGHAGNLIGVPLRRASTLAGFDHEQCRLRFGEERFDLLMVAAQTPLDLGGRTVAESQPDDLGRRTEQGGTAAEVAVLRHDGEAVLLRVRSDGRVVRRRQTDRSNVNDISPDVAKAVAQPRREILVEEQLHLPPTATSRRSRSAANARQARMSSRVRSGKSRSKSSSDMPDAT